ncbi:glycoside hydrolase family 2 protein [Hydrocarboniphaga sp.]|uniref:glycoside hydrolase family 2 protein n=1 Tax=Hydrocarboniphaga sp. TaxID=2033016 RepID=UPI003D0D1E66
MSALKPWHWLALLACLPCLAAAQGYTAMPGQQQGAGVVVAAAPATDASVLTNLPGRQRRSLNGSWQALVDPYASGIGDWKAVGKDRVATGKADFYEYGFDDSNTLQVPGDFNTQRPELMYLEGSVWYRKSFGYDAAAAARAGRRLFVHFGGANYRADVFLNGKPLGSHEGGFTPFQFEITGLLADGENHLLVHVNNQRRHDGVPGPGYDWFNYGGLTRDVDLVETPATYVQDYFIQLAPDSPRRVQGWVRVAGTAAQQKVRLRIDELGVDLRVKTDASGYAPFAFDANITPWSPEQPKLYRVRFATPQDALEEEIGFRRLTVRGDQILLNGKPLFLRGVNLHEEIDGRRACSEADAQRMLERVRELGANFARLAHYPHNEYLSRLADRMGILLWQELPVYQSIDFAAPAMQAKLETMLAEMIGRDRNRAAVAFWGIANETFPSEVRNAALTALAARARQLDPTRPVAAAFFGPGIHDGKAVVGDPLFSAIDVIGINEYFGWYTPWPVEPEQVRWVAPGKPMLISEFGAEARLGNHGSDDVASAWNEEFQAEFYRKQFRMLRRIPFLSGTVPWVLMDFRSPVRLHPFQQGYNRKGLLSEGGDKKLAWQVIHDFYEKQR